jgi:hypothetical protein
MTKTKKRMQTGGWEWPWSNTTEVQPVGPPADAQVGDATNNVNGSGDLSISNKLSDTAAKVREEIRERTGFGGGSRRRRSRCTKKHRHSSACKKLKAKKSKGRKRR